MKTLANLICHALSILAVVLVLAAAGAELHPGGRPVHPESQR